MEITELVKQIFEVCLFPLLGVLTTFLILFINKKSQELKAATDNELYHKYIDMLEQTVVNCVIATNQTYVDSLKKQGKFDKEAQLEAFNRTYNQIMLILADDAKVYLESAVGDLNAYVTNMIETQVKLNRG